MLLAPELDWEFVLPLRRLSGRHVYLIPSAVERVCGAPAHHVEAVGRNLLFRVALGPPAPPKRVAPEGKTTVACPEE